MTVLTGRGKGRYVPVPDAEDVIPSQEGEDTFIVHDSDEDVEVDLTARQLRQPEEYHFNVVCKAFSYLLTTFYLPNVAQLAGRLYALMAMQEPEDREAFIREARTGIVL